MAKKHTATAETKLKDLVSEYVPVDMPPVASIQFKALLFKTIVLTFLFIFVFTSITLAVLGYAGYRKLASFSVAAGVSLPELKQQIETGLQTIPTATDGHKNILLLGTDSLTTRPGSPPLTDTMLLVSIDLNGGGINTLAIPRDLWSQEYQTKVNALYIYGQDRYPDKPEQFTTETLENLLKIPIHHTIVLSMDDVAQLIDALGGIEVDVSEGFVDTQFPRSDVDVTTETDPEKLYMSVMFEPGTQMMDAETALQFIRSRHSTDDEGTDISRGKRQQQVLVAIFRTVLLKVRQLDTQTLGRLYNFYSTKYGQEIPPEEVLATAKAIWPHRQAITFNSHTISVYPESENGVLMTPTKQEYYLYNNQWVFAIRDINALQREVLQALYPEKPV